MRQCSQPIACFVTAHTCCSIFFLRIKLVVATLTLLHELVDETLYFLTPCRQGGRGRVSCWLDERDLPRSFLRPQRQRGGGLTFTTEAVVQADRRGREAAREIAAMSHAVVQELLGEVRHSIGCLYKLSEVVGCPVGLAIYSVVRTVIEFSLQVSSLDVSLSLAEVSSMRGYVRPTFGPSTAVIRARYVSE